MLLKRCQKQQYFIRGVVKITKPHNYTRFAENEEMQNVEKTIGESMISKRSTVVVGTTGLATRAAPQPEAKN